MTGRQGLNLKNIQCRTTNTLLLERFHEGSFMHERSSPNVDYDGVGFHQFDLALADHASSLWRARRGQQNEVA